MKLCNSYILRLLFLAFIILGSAPTPLHARSADDQFRAQVETGNEDLPLERHTDTIRTQQWFLMGASFVIIVLIGLFYYIYRLNKRLRHNDMSQRELNQRVLAVVNNTDSLIISLNENGDIRLINNAAIQLFKKWLGKELQAGDNILKATEGSLAKKMWASWLSKSEGVPAWREVSQIEIQGKKHYYQENFSAITRNETEYAGMVMVGNDITREHEFNVQIAEQHSLLEKSNKAKERMLSILAHDLKDAVYSALSMSQLVVEEPEEFSRDELLRLFKMMNNNFEKTQHLLEGLLTWMRTQTGALEAKPTGFSLKEAAEEVLMSCEENSQKKEIDLQLKLPEYPEVMADREMIKSVIRNLVSNAIKYSPKGSGEVEISGYTEGNSITLHVKDNGLGIPPEDQAKILNGLGTQSRRGTNNERGTGLGISLCKELLKLNNTSLHLKSTEGQGSDFYFRLPLAEQKEPAHQ